MAAAPTFNDIKKQISTRHLAPVYLLHGEEGYYIDVLAKEFETVIPDADKDFNQYILYAPEVLPGKIIDLCYKCPMMSDRQLVIVKECQAAKADQINKLYKYVQNPSAGTVLVIIFRGQKAKGKELISAVKSKGVVFESVPVRDYAVGPLINNIVKEKGLNIDNKSVEMLKDYIGTDLSRLYNEIDKLSVILGRNAAITPAIIEKNIGISKDFNTFELLDAIATRNSAKAFRIIDYFKANPKSNPLPVATSLLYNLFSDLLVAFYALDKSDRGLMTDLNYKSTFALKRIRTGMASYNAFQVIEIISALRRFDAMSKGNGSRQNEHDLFRDLIFHILSAPGRISV